MGVKITWICLPLGLVLSCCEPIEQGKSEEQKPVAGPLQAGQFARTMIDNTSFFHHLPLTGAQADLLLQRHTAMRVIQLEPGYSKVELDSGEVGYVQSAMLEPIPRETPTISHDDSGPSNVPDPQPDPGIPGLPPLPPTIDPE